MSDMDRKIYQILRNHMLEEQLTTGEAFTFPSTRTLVNYVLNMDISLKRQKVVLIESSIQRVLPGLKQQQQEENSALVAATPSAGATEAHSSDEEPDFDGSLRFDGLEAVPTMEVKNNNAMNGSLMRLWGARSESAATAVGTTSSAPATPFAGADRSSAADPTSIDKPAVTEAASSKESDRTKAGDKDARKKKRVKAADRTRYTPPETRLSDLGGVDACIEEVLELIVMPLKHPEIYLHTGVQPPRGVLLHGPPGCGKTLLANAIAGEVGVPFLQISAPSIVSGMSGESEKKLREVFEEARELAPCIVFIDEIDAITPKRENAQREMERRIVAQMLTCIDDLSWDKTDNRPVMLIGATNRPDSLDPALRRAGRFDREIAMSVPDEDAREQILNVLCTKLLLAGDFDIRELAKRTPGYVGADLTALTTAAGMIAVKRIFHKM
ncbi:Ribosome biogenesis ATPase rix7, partial [Kickxella alabastrina]